MPATRVHICACSPNALALFGCCGSHRNTLALVCVRGGGHPQNAMKKLAKSGGKKKEKKQWAQPSGGDKPKKEKKAEVCVVFFLEGGEGSRQPESVMAALLPMCDVVCGS